MKIPKKLLDALIYLERLYWQDGEKELLQGIFALAMEIEEKCGVDWTCVKELVSSIVRNNGFCQYANNERIYEVLKVLGWEVADEVKEGKSL